MTWYVTFHTALLFTAAGLSAWVAVLARGRMGAPGGGAFAWMMLAITHWAATSALHAVVPSQTVRVGISMVQYVAIAALPPLWMLFTSQYGRLRWTNDTTLRGLLWLLPAVTVVLAFTNPWHGLLWSDIVPLQGGLLIKYEHGPWFWLMIAYTYVLILTGTIVLMRTLRKYPLPHRRQTVLILIGSLLPWFGNVVYVLELFPIAGIDVTPLAFAASGTLILWGMHRHRLLGLVPVARDLVVENLDDAIFVLDAQRAVLDLNPAAMRLSGRTEEAIGLPIGDVVPWWNEAGAVGSGTETQPALVTLAADSKSFEVDVRPVRDARRWFAGWLVRIRDVTARRASEVERNALERRVQEQQRLESLSVLAGGVAHEFNNLLTGILGNADLVSMEATAGSPLRRSADAIILGAQRAADLVAQMLAYAGEGQVMAETINLDELVRDMLDLLGASVARHCALSYEPLGAPPSVRVDAGQVRQVALNLIANAAEAAPDGTRIVVRTGMRPLSAADLSRMTFSATASPGVHAFLEVHDTGPGMDGETLTHIFDPFFSTKTTGRGLGLAAVQGIVRGHRGAIEVASTVGAGTTFRVWLPAAAAAR